MSQYPAVIDVAALNGADGFRLSGSGAGAQLGYSVAAGGDINGDGFADLILGAPDNGLYGGPRSGAAYVVFGSASGFAADVQLSSLSGSNGFRITGLDPIGGLGASVTSGDINGDGFSDIVLGSPGQLYAYDQAAYVVFGRGAGFAPSLDVSGLTGGDGFKFTVGSSNANFGAGVSTGDINGDSFDDLLVSSGFYVFVTSVGRGSVVSGHAGTFPANIPSPGVPGASGGPLGNWLGGVDSVTTGDVNGDGIADLIVASPEAFGHYLGFYGGSVYVVFGTESGIGTGVNAQTLNGIDGFKIAGRPDPSPIGSGDHIGSSIAAADINGDGYADLAFTSDTATYVVFGKAGGFAPTLDLSNPQLGVVVLAGSTGSVASVGDVNGDGFDDVAINGAVVFGKVDGFGAGLDLAHLNSADGFRIVDSRPGDRITYPPRAAGDLNGDGVGDMILGEPSAGLNGSYAGAAFVVYGRLPDTAVTRVGSRASQTLVGGDFADQLSGLAGDDRLYGHGGDDTLDGGSGDDTAVYYGPRASYLITTAASGVTTLQDLRSGSPDGADTLANVEHLKFADQTVSLSPPPMNLAPVAGPDSLSTPYATALRVPVATLLVNDSDPNGDSLSITTVGGAQHGTVALNGGVVTFTPFTTYAGPAGFTYTLDDGHGATATGQVTVTVSGTSPGYIYRAGVTAPETIDTTGDALNHNIVLGSGDDVVFTGPGGSSVKLGAGHDMVIGGAGKDTITFGPGLGEATGGSGPDVFVFVKGQIADPTAHGGAFDTVTDFSGAGSTYAPGRDLIYLKGFAGASTITYEHDLTGNPTAHLYRVDDGAYHAEFVLQYAATGVDLVKGQFGFL